MFSSFLQKKKAFPSVGQDRPTLLTQLGNQNTGFISSCPVSHGRVAERLERRTFCLQYCVCCIIPYLILRAIEQKKLFTIVCYDSILNKFAVLYCEWPKCFPLFCRKRRHSRALGKTNQPCSRSLAIRTRDSFHHARSAMAKWLSG